MLSFSSCVLYRSAILTGWLSSAGTTSLDRSHKCMASTMNACASMAPVSSGATAPKCSTTSRSPPSLRAAYVTNRQNSRMMNNAKLIILLLANYNISSSYRSSAFTVASARRSSRSTRSARSTGSRRCPTTDPCATSSGLTPTVCALHFLFEIFDQPYICSCLCN